MLAVLVVIVVVAVVLGLYVMGLYNKLVALSNVYKNAWAEIDVQLKRRYDLIPNLVEAVKGYMAHEKGTLDAVISARGAAMGAAQLAGTENTIAQSRSGYNATILDYNNARQMFPAVMFAGPLGFGEKQPLEATESAEERKAPKVSFK